MGKKSLTQSTTKKKKTSAAKKKTPQKKTAAASAKNTKTTKTRAKTTAKKPSLKSLLKKQFDPWTPEKPFAPETGPEAEKRFAAPPLTGDYPEKDGERIRTLLLKQIDLGASEPQVPPGPAEPEPSGAEPPKAHKEAQVAAALQEPAEPGQTEAPQEAVSEEQTGAPGPAAAARKAAQEEKPAEPEAAEKPAETVAGAEPQRKEAGPAGVENADKRQPEPPGPSGPQGPPPGGGEPPQPPAGAGREPLLDKGLLLLVGAVALVFVLITGASIANMDNYYLRQTNAGLEIYRGKFSPRGKVKIAFLPGLKAQLPEKEVYSRKQALAPAFDYYLEKADALGKTGELPDFEKILKHLARAKKYAVTDEQRRQVNRRINHIKFLALLYKADLAAQKQDRQALQAALENLEQASDLALGEENRLAVKKRMEETRKALKELEKQEAPAAGQKAGAPEKPGKAPTEPKKPEEPEKPEKKTGSPDKKHEKQKPATGQKHET